MNPQAIRIAFQYPNMKMIWFPTFTSLGFWRGAGQPEKGGVRLVSESGEVRWPGKPRNWACALHWIIRSSNSISC